MNVQFEPFCVFCSKNANNSESEVVLYELEVAAMADVILQGWVVCLTLHNQCESVCVELTQLCQHTSRVSRPNEIVFPPPNSTLHQSLTEEADVGPELQQVFEVHFISLMIKKTCSCLSWALPVGLTESDSNSWWIMAPAQSARQHYKSDVPWGPTATVCFTLWRWWLRVRSAAPPEPASTPSGSGWGAETTCWLCKLWLYWLLGVAVCSCSLHTHRLLHR